MWINNKGIKHNKLLYKFDWKFHFGKFDITLHSEALGIIKYVLIFISNKFFQVFTILDVYIYIKKTNYC